MPPRRALFLVPLLISLLSAALLTLPSPVRAWDWSWSGSGPALVGSGKIVDDTRSVSAFSRIRLEGPFNLRVSKTGIPSVIVRADDNLLSLVSTEVEGNTLVIRSRPGYSMRSRQPLLVMVGTDNLAAVDMRGSGAVWVQGVKGERFELQLSGSGDAKLSELDLHTLAVGLAGSGDITAQGRCDDAQLSIAGSGDLRMAELQTQRVTVSIAGSGNASVHAALAINARVFGSGDVRYSGNPGSVKSNVAGSGSVAAVR